MGIAKVNQEDLVTLGELLKDGKLAPSIDRRYPLNETADALRHIAEQHAQGKIVIEIFKD
jgi:NADPH:quinone reductase-like Zn-dependent oxidoreductase